ncbi:hypothetical protein I4U23_012762 [Adineta vaga]|nr:hypothetical protein I4U23_012762 [Adineta vaga]
MCLFLASGISLYFYNRHKYAPSSKVTPVNVITISRLSQSENFNEPVSFIQLSAPSQPPAYTSVFTNISN